MRIFITYFLLELKRGIKVFTKSFLLLCIGFALIGGCVFALSHFLLEGQTFKAADVGVVIPKSENDTKIVFRFASSAESVKSVSNFHYMNFDDALEGLKSSELQAVIVFPENFYEDVFVGRNTPAEVYFSREQSFNAVIFRELIVSAVSFLQISESGVYSMLNTARKFGSDVSQNEIGGTMAAEYGKIFLKRDKIFDKYVLSPFGLFEAYQYYLSAFFAILLCMLGLNFSFLYKKQTKSIEEKLRVYSLGEVKLGIIKLAVMTIILWLVGAAVYIAGNFLWEALDVDYFRVDFYFLIGLVPLCLSIAMYFHIIYSACNSGMQAVFVLLAFNAAMIICSGAVLPSAYLPKPAAAAGIFMPLGCWSEFTADTAFGDGVMYFKLIWVIVAELSIGALISWKNTLCGIGCS